MSFEGITASRTIPKLGYKGLETVEMSYVDHRVPAANILGGEEGIGMAFVRVGRCIPA